MYGSGNGGTDAEDFSEPYQISKRLSFHLLHHLGPVYLYGLFAYSEIVGRLFIEHAADDKLENFTFPRGQGIQSGS